MTKFANLRGHLIALEPTNFGASYHTLFGQTDVSVAEQYAVYSHNNFNNLFAEANEALFERMGYWGAISRDKIMDSTGMDDKGRLLVKYVSHAGLPDQREHTVYAPKNGFYVPTSSGIFVPETGIPFETVQKREEAIARLEKAGIPKEQVSYFYRNDNYHDAERFVGRDFDPLWGGGGRFYVDAGRLPSIEGCAGVGSLPAYRVPEIVFRID